MDVFTREALAIEVGQSIKGDEVVRTLNRVKLDREVPKVMICKGIISSTQKQARIIQVAGTIHF